MITINKQLFMFVIIANIFTENTYSFWEKKEKEEINQEYNLKSGSTIDIININGNITITGYKQANIEIKVIKNGTVEDNKNTNITVKNSENKIKIITKVTDTNNIATTDYIISVPRKCNLNIKNSNSGNIKIKSVTGSIDAWTLSGSIEIEDTIETVNAKTQNGNITLKQKEFSEPESILLDTQKGDINLFLPKNAQANIQAKTASGVVTSEQEITLDQIAVKLNKETWNRLKKEAKGSINSGGGFIKLDTAKGNIYLKES